MKKWLAALCLSIIAPFCLAQLQTGSCYFNFKSLQSNTFDTTITFTVKYADNGYEMAFRTNDDALTNMFAIYEVYAIRINDTLWLNGKKQDTGNKYYRALTKGSLIAFRGSVDESKRLGGNIGDVYNSFKRSYYVLSLRTGNTRNLTPEYIEQRLNEISNKELLSQFKAEKDKDSPDVLLKYISLLNEYMATNSGGPAKKN